MPRSAPDPQGYMHIGGEYWFSVNGVELRSAGPGSTYRLDFVDCADDPFRATCP